MKTNGQEELQAIIRILCKAGRHFGKLSAGRANLELCASGAVSKKIKTICAE